MAGGLSGVAVATLARPERPHGSKGFLVRCVTDPESRVNVS